jgi:hypothetical protein
MTPLQSDALAIAERLLSEARTELARQRTIQCVRGMHRAGRRVVELETIARALGGDGEAGGRGE